MPPGCLQTCGPISVSFIDAEHGYAEASPQKGDSRLFATEDGGSTWLPVASMPNLGSVLVGGPIAEPQLLFTSKLDGWALTGPSGTDDRVSRRARAALFIAPPTAVLLDEGSPGSASGLRTRCLPSLDEPGRGRGHEEHRV